MKLTLDTLERARHTASPSDAILLADAIADLEALDAAMSRNGWTLDNVPAALDDFAAVVNHVAAQPFEMTAMDDGTTVVDDVTPGSFADWIQTLESLAQ